MKIKTIIYLAASIVLMSSCVKEAEIGVTNKLSSVSIKKVYLGKSVMVSSGSIMPGVTVSSKIKENTDVTFPIIGQLEFYMVSGDNSVFLKTKEVFELRQDNYLNIEITNDTEVYNPMFGPESAVGLREMTVPEQHY